MTFSNIFKFITRNLKVLASVLPLIVLVFGVIQFTQINTYASITDLDVLGIPCLLPGQNGCSLEASLVGKIMEFLLSAAVPLAGLVILWGGYQYFFSGLVEGQADGKKTILAGVTGLVIVLMARAITTVVQGSVGNGTFNANPLTGFIGSISGFLFTIATVVATLVIIWGGYEFFFSGLPGQQKDGKETIIKGVTGLVVVLIARALSEVISKTITGTNTLTLDKDPIVNFIKLFLTSFLIPISTVVTVFFFVLGAYYLLTGGDSENVKKGKQSMINALIGLIVVLLATTIAQLVVTFLPISS